MARSIKTTHASSARAPAPVPKKRLGRPPGSKNRATALTKAKPKAAPVASTRRAAPRKATVPVAPKLNKAELEQQVVKLERTIGRLRKQIAELKQAAREEVENAGKAVPVTAPAVTRASRRGAAPKVRGGKSPVEEPAAPAAYAENASGAAEQPVEDVPAVAAAARKPPRRSSKSKAPRAVEPVGEPEPLASGDTDDEVDPED